MAAAAAASAACRGCARGLINECSASPQDAGVRKGGEKFRGGKTSGCRDSREAVEDAERSRVDAGMIREWENREGRMVLLGFLAPEVFLLFLKA